MRQPLVASSRIGLLAACWPRRPAAATPSAGGSTDVPSASRAAISPTDPPSSGGRLAGSERRADPSDELGAVHAATCRSTSTQTVARANITDVRIGTHDGYDRVVFEFAGGLPEVSLERAEPPFTHDASGEPIDGRGRRASSA